MEKYNTKDIIKKIDLKIAELEKQEDAVNLFKKSLLKKNIILSIDEISDEKANELLELIKNKLKEEK